MPYTLTFNGNFFQIADFIKGLDSMVKTQNEEVTVDGRLLTVNGFSLAGGARRPNSPTLEATFSVTTYLTPPGEGLAGGAIAGKPRTAPKRRRSRRRPEGRGAMKLAEERAGAEDARA